MERRKFLELSASAGLLTVLNAHALLAQTGCTTAAKSTSQSPLIASLRLQTTASLENMKRFYAETIGLPVSSAKEGELTIQAGETPITFVKTERQDIRPFYHFAFNIPENKIQSAFEWQRPKTPLVKPGVDSIVNFNHWNAHSIFFLDPAGNLVEYIARHDLKNASPGPFSPKDILYASEIAFIVTDVTAAGNAVNKQLGIEVFRPAVNGFWAFGNDHGLLLMIGKGRIWASHPGEVNETSVFETSASIRTPNKSGLKFSGYPYEIKAV
jgi:catechol-2,3-dioxygenase